MVKIRKGLLQAGVEAALGTHAVLSLTSLAYGIYGRKTSTAFFDQEEAFDAKYYQFVTDFVRGMYSGKGTDRPNVIFGENITFEDPAAICSSPKEVHEAFRALKCATPESLSTPKCVDVKPKGASIQLTYVLNQRYADVLDVKSLLIVEVHLAQIEGTADSNFIVDRFEEQW
eukprot:CAMPEP_0198146300 /NCGR_PEP_ID=MMETSP1443-20131203/28717_1 /TAXON_ID=186043 /ORGANISM="Entomoneis sp., Strain CCMP2396" /LENGTH=171 /DNA_ID=CAMNT_0043810219 /DNA_START=134 /DNA_END=646 /DNA_ORIENTATION=+